jgi:hypothetical protein
VSIRLVRPDIQCERLIGLFRGSRAAHPAAALASWRRTASGREGLGKAAEAAIALLNPAMEREYRTLRDAEIGIDFGPAEGEVHWRVRVPGDDGTLAALATALALTGGGSAPPLNGVAVDRLGPPGAPLMARSPEVLALAGTRDELRAALEMDPSVDDGPDAIDSGWIVRLDPASLRLSGSPRGRRAVDLLRATGFQAIEGTAGLDGDAVVIAVTAQISNPLPPGEGARRAVEGPPGEGIAPENGTPTLDPHWLDAMPASTTVLAVALALDPRPEAWDSAFAAADRLERTDPARAGVAPLRIRLNLLAAAAGVRPEVDLWPHLRGLSGCLLAGPSGGVEGAMLALHTDGPSASLRLADPFIPRMTRLVTRETGPDEPGPEGVRRLGQVAGRPITLARRGATVLIGWGESALPACLDAREHPGRSASEVIRSGWGPTPPQRAGAFWPGRVRGLAPAGTPISLALAETPPVLWSGRTEGAVARDTLRWAGLSGLVRRFLEHLPLDPPPDSSSPALR